MSRGILAAVAAMAAVVVASNILVQHLFGQWLTWGAFTYPLAFLVTDLTNRLHGPAAARRVVLAGFATGVVCSLIGSQIEGEYGPLVSQRVAIASGTAFLVAQLLDVGIFQALRKQAWWKAPLASSVLGGAVDTALFFSMAFAASLSALNPVEDVSWAGEVLPLLGMGPEAPLWVSLAVADYGVKLGIAILALIPFRLLVRRLRPVENL
ncbi:queuosine precursor transporter [Halovulum dunhuangense]|uniref:Probable queuosine precursor transporter n=1 Tax=Halovulum dunhuangense TaxID=1505036 RepID=A0A849KQY7_9RHOB|nr:queuosine precursor transporter [Halovulum dunhuangense]NNU79279.1 queuosine precursor transporter [Halovulum dunhuangense]